MNHQTIERLSGIMTANKIKFNKQFTSVLEHGFTDEARETFFEETIDDLDALLRHGVNSEFNKSMKEAITALTDLAVKAGEETKRSSSLERLRFDNNINLIDSNVSVLDSIGAITEAISDNIERTMEDGDETEESVKKKKKALKTLQDIQMAVTIAAIAADTAAGIMGIWRGYALEKVANAETAAAAGPAAAPTLAVLNAKSLAAAILQTTAMGVMGAAQIASAISGTISNKKSIDAGEDNGGVAGTIAAPAVIDTTPYSYTRQVQTTEEEEKLNQPIWVSVTDIESGLYHAKVVQNESSW
jgi:hypothetical protein